MGRRPVSVIGIVDDGELGVRAGVLAQKLELEEAAPSWLGDVGEAEITGAAVMREDVFDEASTVSRGSPSERRNARESAC